MDAGRVACARVHEGRAPGADLPRRRHGGGRRDPGDARRGPRHRGGGGGTRPPRRGPGRGRRRCRARPRRRSGPSRRGSAWTWTARLPLELERLPRVGKRLAERIVADRQVNGPFGSLAGLGRVPGVSSRPAARPHAVRQVRRRSCLWPRSSRPALPDPRPAAPASRAAPAASAAQRPRAACAGEVAVNRATPERAERACPASAPSWPDASWPSGTRTGRSATSPIWRGFRGSGRRRIERLKGHVTIP